MNFTGIGIIRSNRNYIVEEVICGRCLRKKGVQFPRTEEDLDAITKQLQERNRLARVESYIGKGKSQWGAKKEKQEKSPVGKTTIM